MTTNVYTMKAGESMLAAKKALPNGGTIQFPDGYRTTEDRVILNADKFWKIASEGKAHLPSVHFQGGSAAGFEFENVTLPSVRVVAKKIPGVVFAMNGVALTGGIDSLAIIDQSRSFAGRLDMTNCQQSGNATTGEKSQGVFVDGMEHAGLYRCTFDGSLAPRNTRNHNVYGQDGVRMTVFGCLFRNAPSHAIQGRGDLYARDNIFLDCPCGIKGSGWRGGELGIIGNVFLGGGDIDATNARCWGVEVKPMARVCIDGNIFAHGRTNGRNAYAVRYAPQPGDEPNYPMPATETIAWGRNYVDGWPGGVRNDRGLPRTGDLIAVRGVPTWADFTATGKPHWEAAAWFRAAVAGGAASEHVGGVTA